MPVYDFGKYRCAILVSALTLTCFVAGCAEKKKSTKPSTTTPSSTSAQGEATEGSPKSDSGTSKPKFEAVTLGSGSESSTGAAGTSAGTEAEQMETVVQALKPMQIMLGRWRGTTNQKFKGFSAVEELEWIWDFRTDRAQPALTVKSDKSPYIREGRLTFLPQDQVYQFTVKNPDGVEHVLKGKFERDPDEFTGDDNKPQRTYKLVLSEAEPQGGEAWKVTLDQQENNRYLVQLSRKRGSGQFQLADTVGTQRLGTSFAASDEDYGEKKCIISGGLGTSTVSYNGKTYWVCCSGCQAAFNDDPKRWLAKMEEADKAKK